MRVQRGLARTKINAAMKILAAILATLVLTGCVNLLDKAVPGLITWHYYAVDGIEITVDQAAFIVPHQTTKADVVAHFGHGGLNKPAWERPDGRAIAYTWIEIRNGERGAQLHRPFGPHKGEVLYDYSDDWSETRAICLVFDAADRVVRYHFFAAKDADALGALFQKWAQPNAPEDRTRPNPAREQPTVNSPAAAEGKPDKIQASSNGAASNPALPVPSPHGEKPYELPRFLVQGEFQMSFGFGVKILKDGLTKKVMMMYVDTVDPDSDAWRKGLESGTRIVAIDGTPVTEFDATFGNGSALNRIFSTLNRGAKVTLEVIPMGFQATRTITIAGRPGRFDPENLVLDRMR